MISGIHHVALKCRGSAEFEKTIAFYHDLLGLPILRRWGVGADAGVMFDCGGGRLEIFANADEIRGEGAIRHIALATDDPDAYIEAVSAAGYTVIEAPHDIVIPSTPPFPARIAFCCGPVGEKIEFFCEKES